MKAHSSTPLDFLVCCRPAKKTDYYMKRLPEELHDTIVELAPEKKAKANK